MFAYQVFGGMEKKIFFFNLEDQVLNLLQVNSAP